MAPDSPGRSSWTVTLAPGQKKVVRVPLTRRQKAYIKRDKAKSVTRPAGGHRARPGRESQDVYPDAEGPVAQAPEAEAQALTTVGFRSVSGQRAGLQSLHNARRGGGTLRGVESGGHGRTAVVAQAGGAGRVGARVRPCSGAANGPSDGHRRGVTAPAGGPRRSAAAADIQSVLGRRRLIARSRSGSAW